MPRILLSHSSSEQQQQRRNKSFPCWAHNFQRDEDLQQQQETDQQQTPSFDDYIRSDNNDFVEPLSSISTRQYHRHNQRRREWTTTEQSSSSPQYYKDRYQRSSYHQPWSIILPSMTNTSSSSDSSQGDVREHGMPPPEATQPSYLQAPPTFAGYENPSSPPPPPPNTAPTSRPPPRTYNVESTADGDVVVVEPSFDEGEDPAAATTSNTNTNMTTYTTGSVNWQSRSPMGDEKSRSPGKRTSPAKGHRSRHSRNLSAHFFDATKITAEDYQEAPDQPRYSTKGGIKHDVSPAVGQKHRRMFSGDVSNPPLAHRRINSIGNAAAVERRYPQPRGKRHQRENSAGLDILSAAAGVSNDELAAAAGAKPSPTSSPWEPPSQPPTNTSLPGGAGQPPSEYAQPQYCAPTSTATNTTTTNTMGPPPVPTSTGSESMKPPPPVRAAYAPPPVHGHHPPPPPPPPHVQHYVHHSSLPHPTVPYHHPPYPPPTYYAPPPPPPGSAVRPMRYPVQYAHPPPPPQVVYKGPPPVTHSYAPPPPPPQVEDPAETGDRQPSPSSGVAGDEKIESDEQLFANKTQQQGVQTFVTAISVSDGTRTLQPSNAANEPPPLAPASSSQYHHRKLSSFSSMAGLMGSSIFSPNNPPAESGEGEHPLKGHHRVTSSTVSFLNGLDVLEGSDVNFLRNLHASTPSYGGGPLTSTPSHMNYSEPGPETTSTQPVKLAAGGTSKRVRRKCTVEGCPNRVVQGGRCISHGAKRKTCKHPGCTKNVKKAGLCSTHGPARKRCEAEGCTKVAVQGGKCIAHGAKKKLCSVENCKKQAILSGMCKKHHDKSNGISGSGGRSKATTVSDPATEASTTNDKGVHKPSHTRGLSIFQDLTADAVSDLLADEDDVYM